MAIKSKFSVKKSDNESYSEEKINELALQYSNLIVVESADEMIKLFEGKKLLFCDTEDKPLTINSNELVAPHVRRWIGSGKNANPVDKIFCLSIGDGETFASLFDDSYDLKETIKIAKHFMEDASIAKVYHNIKFDATMLSNAGVKLRGRWHDTAILVKVIDENLQSYTCLSLAFPLGGIKIFEDMVETYKKRNKIKDYSKMPRKMMGLYANADIFNVAKIWYHYEPLLDAEGVRELYDNEMAIAKMAFDMEQNGMRMDIENKDSLIAELQARKDKYEQLVYDEAGYVFNINSTAQLKKAIVATGVDESQFKTTEKGNVKLDKDEMKRFSRMGVNIVNNVLACKQTEKLLTTYAVGMYSQADKEGYVHANINTGEAVTGRMSVTKPALQTLPKKDKTIRNLIIPTDGYRMFAYDLDQVEYRFYAHYSHDENLCEMIRKGYDIHKATAALIYNKPYEDVTDNERSAAKAINFGLIYGMGVGALADILGMTSTEASEFRARYFTALPKAKPFIDGVQRAVRQRGFIFNLYKRRRRLTPNECYKAVNSLIQGVAADYIKHQSILMYKYCILKNVDVKWLMFVHDEILFELREGQEEHLPFLRTLMSDFTNFRTYITAGAEECIDKWGNKKDMNEEIGFVEISPELMEEIKGVDIWA